MGDYVGRGKIHQDKVGRGLGGRVRWRARREARMGGGREGGGLLGMKGGGGRGERGRGG